MKRYKTIVVAAALDDRDATTLAFAAQFAKAAESENVYITHVAPSFDLPAEAAAQHPELFLPLDEDIEQRLRASRGLTMFFHGILFATAASLGFWLIYRTTQRTSRTLAPLRSASSPLRKCSTP
jgi:hypothetical protein